jgi:hypothetical protein
MTRTATKALQGGRLYHHLLEIGHGCIRRLEPRRGRFPGAKGLKVVLVRALV